eukprot:2036911-Pyramimonas_sp.AAC.1
MVADTPIVPQKTRPMSTTVKFKSLLVCDASPGTTSTVGRHNAPVIRAFPPCRAYHKCPAPPQSGRRANRVGGGKSCRT